MSIKPQVAPLAVKQLAHSVGTLLAGKTVQIQFQVTVNNPYSVVRFVANQGTVSGTGFRDVLTDDPAVGGANNPTQTPILLRFQTSRSLMLRQTSPPRATAPMLFYDFAVGPSACSRSFGPLRNCRSATRCRTCSRGNRLRGHTRTRLSISLVGEQLKTVVGQHSC